jgi:hypothetical protein
VATTEAELRQAVNACLRNPTMDRQAQAEFVVQECTFTDGSAGRRTGQYLVGLANGTPDR